MSGHNKWSQIKEKKGRTDAYKSKIFGRLARLITVEAKKAMGNKEAPGLKSAIEKARAENMPNDNIERAIKKASDAGSASLENIIYEAYGPGGVAIIIEALTDNKNKAVQEIKTTLAKNNTELASPGSAMWAFKKVGNIFEPVTTTKIEEVDTPALEKLIDELDNCDEVQEVFTNAE
jgi:YebC/PmpR family DNA-binding regulatory protein